MWGLSLSSRAWCGPGLFSILEFIDKQLNACSVVIQRFQVRERKGGRGHIKETVGHQIIQVRRDFFFSFLVDIPHVTLSCTCPLILFAEQENSCKLSSNGLFSTINLFFSLLFPSKMTQIILAFPYSECSILMPCRCCR